MLIQLPVCLLLVMFYSHAHFMTAWVGAAPTGNRKRAVSNADHGAQAAQPAKKVKKGLNHTFLR